MLKVNELFDRTSKVVSSVAAVSLALAVITVSAVVIKENIKDLLHLRKIKAHVICVRSHSDEEENGDKDKSEPESPKPAPKKGGSRKAAPKADVNNSVSEESAPAPERK